MDPILRGVGTPREEALPGPLPNEPEVPLLGTSFQQIERVLLHSRHGGIGGRYGGREAQKDQDQIEEDQREERAWEECVPMMKSGPLGRRGEKEC